MLAGIMTVVFNFGGKILKSRVERSSLSRAESVLVAVTEGTPRESADQLVNPLDPLGRSGVKLGNEQHCKSPQFVCCADLSFQLLLCERDIGETCCSRHSHTCH